ncbi:MAG: hypothetical protein ABIY51_05520 [Ferruginibacter sp.]
MIEENIDKRNNEDLTGMESLAIIHKMINQAKNKVNSNGNEWIIWGTMIFLASLSTYFFSEFGYPQLFLGWNIFGILAIIILGFRVFQRRTKKVRTYLDDLLVLFHIGFVICLFIIIFSINVAVGPNAGFGYFLMIYAFLMLIQGGAMKFKPLIAGAIVNWIGSVAIFINTDFKYDMLITAASVFIGYIIPGIILRVQSNKKNKLNNSF